MRGAIDAYFDMLHGTFKEMPMVTPTKATPLAVRADASEVTMEFKGETITDFGSLPRAVRA